MNITDLAGRETDGHESLPRETGAGIGGRTDTSDSESEGEGANESDLRSRIYAVQNKIKIKKE